MCSLIDTKVSEELLILSSGMTNLLPSRRMQKIPFTTCAVYFTRDGQKITVQCIQVLLLGCFFSGSLRRNSGFHLIIGLAFRFPRLISFCALCLSVCASCHHPLCLRCFRLANILKFLAGKILIHRRKQIIIAGQHVH